MKVFKKKLVQRFSCVCGAVLFAVFSVFTVCDFSRSKESEVISASAEESFEVPSSASPIYYLYFPAGFRLDFTSGSSDFFSYGSGIGFNTNIVYIYDKSFKSNKQGFLSYALSPYACAVSSLDNYTVPNSMFPHDAFFYCLSDYTSHAVYKDLYFPLYTDRVLAWLDYHGLTFSSESTSLVLPSDIVSNICFSFRSNYNNTTLVCLDTSLVLLRSSFVYSQSDVDNAYNHGYNAGYSTGEQDTRDEAFNEGYGVGVEDGKQEAEDKSKRGLFASFESIVVDAYDSSGGFLHSIEADYGVNALSFETAFLEYEYMIENGQLTPSYYKIYFTTEHGYDYEIPLEMLEIIAYGDKSLFGEENSFVGQGSDYYSQTWRNYPMYFDTSQGSDGYPLVIEYNNNDPHLSRARLNNFSVNVPNLELLRNLQFVSSSGYYSQGYTQGVKDGYSSGLTDGEKVGYDKGYEYGENVGFNRGVEAGNEYSFLNLLTAVIDAPIKSFLGLLDFEVLGMDMQRFFLSILSAALCIAVYRLFSGSAV